jgi:hypothetical protein
VTTPTLSDVSIGDIIVIRIGNVFDDSNHYSNSNGEGKLRVTTTIVVVGMVILRLGYTIRQGFQIVFLGIILGIILGISWGAFYLSNADKLD